MNKEQEARERIAKAIEDYTNEKISFERCAELMGVNFYALSAFCHKHTGKLTVIDWLDSPRLQVEPDKLTVISEEDKLLLELTKNSIKFINPDNPLRVTAAMTYLVDLLNGVEKYLYDFSELMIGAGKAKKEGILHPTDLVHKVENLQTELHMWARLARDKIGNTTNQLAHTKEQLGEGK